MISFKDALPGSYEVTFLPLLLTYVFFALGLSLSIYVALVGPVCYFTMCLLLITPEIAGGIATKVLVAKVFFVVVVLSPAVGIALWKMNAL